jgi:hypothetical protein
MPTNWVQIHFISGFFSSRIHSGAQQCTASHSGSTRPDGLVIDHAIGELILLRRASSYARHFVKRI